MTNALKLTAGTTTARAIYGDHTDICSLCSDNAAYSTALRVGTVIFYAGACESHALTVAAAAAGAGTV